MINASLRRTALLAEILRSENGLSVLPKQILGIEGLSSHRVRCLLNNLCRSFVRHHGYLEVGVFNGSTLISAAYALPELRFVGVDDWSTTQSSGVLDRNISMLAPHVRFIEGDFRKVNVEGPFDVAFYDGSKEEPILRGCLKKLLPMIRGGILVVDDVTELGRWGETERFLFEEVKALGLRFDLYCKLSAEFTGDMDNWWNGIAVMTFL